MRRAFIAVSSLTFAVVACEKIADVEQYHVCEGAECDAGVDASHVTDSGSTAIDSSTDSGKAECTAIDAGTAACESCLEKSCAKDTATCGCDPDCVREIDCYIHSASCSGCTRNKLTTNLLIKCAVDSCPLACACH